MAGRGPLPKDPALRQRRNRASTKTTLPPSRPAAMPSLPGGVRAATPAGGTSLVLAGGLDAVEATAGMAPGGRVIGVTKGQFSLLDLVRAVLGRIGPARVTVSTWTPGRAEMEAVGALLREGRITHFRLLVDRSFPTRHPEYAGELRAIVPETEVRMTRTHAKFALLMAGDWRVTIRTSMNFNSNPRLEQFDLDDDPAVYAFFDGVVEELFAAVPPGLDVPGPTLNAAFTAAFKADQELGAPPGREWHEQTTAWWADIWQSPMASQWETSDQHGLLMLAEMVEAFWRTPGRDLLVKAKLLQEIRMQSQRFGLSPVDRWRLQWEIDRGEEAGERSEQRSAAKRRRPAAGDPRELLKVVG